MQLTDMLILQEEPNPKAQQKQIILCKASLSKLELLSFTPQWPLKLMQEKAENGRKNI